MNSVDILRESPVRCRLRQKTEKKTIVSFVRAKSACYPSKNVHAHYLVVKNCTSFV
jgi:hypothetical protein